MPRILIVEDSPTQAHAFALLLSNAGFEAVTLPDAEGAFERLTQEPFDLVLSDLQLPGNSGFDLCRKIRQDTRFGSLPVVVYTGSDDPVNVLRGLEAGADDFMTKDRHPEVIVARIRRVLARVKRSAAPRVEPLQTRVLEREFELSAGREQLLDILGSAFEDMVHLNTRYKEEMRQRRQAEAALRKAQETAEGANQAKTQFLTGMSHELRTPLNAIIGFTGTLLMELPGPLNPDQKEQLQTVETSASHLLSLINDLLDLARIEAGKVDLRLEPVVCQNVVRDVLASLRSLAEGKGVRLESAMAEQEIVARTDRRALTQVLLNLTNNAIKFTEAGTVRLELAQQLDKGIAVTRVRVTDTGVGIQSEDQARLFQPFQQIAQTRTGQQQGTGLGLHLSQKLAELLGGTIHLQSEFGKGSTFTLILRGH